MNTDFLVKVTAEEYLRMKVIRTDADGSEALAMVNLLVSRIEAGERLKLKSHLDQSRRI